MRRALLRLEHARRRRRARVDLRARERALELERPVCFDPNLRLHRWDSMERAWSRRSVPPGRVAREVQPRRGGAPDRGARCRRGGRGARRRRRPHVGRHARPGRSAAARRARGRRARRPARSREATAAAGDTLWACCWPPVPRRLLPFGARGGAARAPSRPRARATERGERCERRRPRAARVRPIRERAATVYGVPVAPARPAARRARAHGPLAVAPTTATATSPTCACASASRRGRRSATRRCEEVEEAIQPGGISTEVAAHPGDPARAPPRRDARPVVAARRAGRRGARCLCALPGVGRKTAACVLLFAFGLRDVPVTRTFRVATRLRLLRPGAAFDEQHDAMLALDPAGRRARAARQPPAPRPAHCHARARLPECALRRMCLAPA